MEMLLVCLFVCVFICLFVNCLFVCLFVWYALALLPDQACLKGFLLSQIRDALKLPSQVVPPEPGSGWEAIPTAPGSGRHSG